MSQPIIVGMVSDWTEELGHAMIGGSLDDQDVVIEACGEVDDVGEGAG